MESKSFRGKMAVFYGENKIILLAGLACFTLILVVLVSYRLQFSSELSSSQEKWGQFGDYFGGMLNPLLSFAAFLGLLTTIRVQRAESRKTDIRHDAQLYESRVFQLVTSCYSMVSKLHLKILDGDYQGRKLTSAASEDLSRQIEGLGDLLLEISILDNAGRVWDIWKERYWLELSPYFECLVFTVYSIVSPNQKEESKNYYLKFLKSQMTLEERRIFYFFLIFEFRFEIYNTLNAYKFFDSVDGEVLGRGKAQALISFEERVNDPRYSSGPWRDEYGFRKVNYNK